MEAFASIPPWLDAPAWWCYSWCPGGARGRARGRAHGGARSVAHSDSDFPVCPYHRLWSVRVIYQKLTALLLTYLPFIILCFNIVCIFVSPGMQGMADMYGMSPSSYSQMGALRAAGHSQAMLLPAHPHYGMMMAHGGHMGHPGMYGLPTAQSPPLHPGMDAMGHIQDIHAA